MVAKIGIKATLGDLDLISVSIDAEDKMSKAYDIFAKHPSYPGLIVLKQGKLFRMLSKASFFEAMSQQYMFDVYSYRSAHDYFDANDSAHCLILDVNVSVLSAATMALRRPGINRFDPIVVQCTEDDFKILDYYVLLIAENQVHLQTAKFLREANEFKKEVLGVVAHDLQNPIGIILGFANLLISSEPNKEETLEYSKIILDTSQQMNNMVHELLSSAIKDAVDFTINSAQFSLHKLMNQIINNFKESAEAKHQRIRFTSSESSIIINADSSRISEVLENLISNAIKYSEVDTQIMVSVEKLDEVAIIKVTDEGPGFNNEDMAKIFGKFNCLSAKPTAGESSTGLGLFIVKRLVDLLGGKVWVESKLDEGSTFIVELPIDHTPEKNMLGNKAMFSTFSALT
jgi:signal transduction histidine kinase